jgi:hypothetical protein
VRQLLLRLSLSHLVVPLLLRPLLQGSVLRLLKPLLLRAVLLGGLQQHHCQLQLLGSCQLLLLLLLSHLPLAVQLPLCLWLATRSSVHLQRLLLGAALATGQHCCQLLLLLLLLSMHLRVRGTSQVGVWLHLRQLLPLSPSLLHLMLLPLLLPLCHGAGSER